MNRTLPLITLLLLNGGPALAVDFESVFGLVPGEPISYLTEDFRAPPDNAYEKPLPNGELTQYFQHIIVMGLPPRTAATVQAKRAYWGALKCMEDMSSIREYLIPLFPKTKGKNEFERFSEDGEMSLYLGCGTSGNHPHYTLRMHISHKESASELRSLLFGPDR